MFMQYKHARNCAERIEPTHESAERDGTYMYVQLYMYSVVYAHKMVVAASA